MRVEFDFPLRFEFPSNKTISGVGLLAITSWITRLTSRVGSDFSRGSKSRASTHRILIQIKDNHIKFVIIEPRFVARPAGGVLVAAGVTGIG